MFPAAKKPENTDRPTPAMRSSVPSLIAPGLLIEGDIVCRDEIRIAGDVIGDVKAERLIVSHTGSVRGSITADLVEISGHVEGKVTGRDISLTGTASGKGVILATDSLFIEGGSSFEGQIKRVKKPSKGQNGGARGSTNGTANRTANGTGARRAEKHTAPTIN